MNKEKFLQKYGQWAVVTGASSGIGAEFAKQLGSMGFNLVLIARRLENMEILGEELKSSFGVEYKALSVDLAKDGFYQEVEAAIEGLDVGLLVNNAGMNCEGKFYRGGLERNVQMMRLNMEASFILATSWENGLQKRKKEGLFLSHRLLHFRRCHILPITLPRKLTFCH